MRVFRPPPGRLHTAADARRHLEARISPTLDEFSCKWTAGPLSSDEKPLLERLVPHICTSGEEPALYFFSRSGFDDALTEAAAENPRVHLVGPEHLFGG